jgi:hypothetical protein
VIAAYKKRLTPRDEQGPARRSFAAPSVPDSTGPPIVSLRWLGTETRPYLQQFDRRDFGDENWPPAGVQIIAQDERDQTRFWGIDQSKTETTPKSWHVPAWAILSTLRNGQPARYVWGSPKYREAGEAFGQPHLSAMLRSDCGMAAPADRDLLEDLELAQLAGGLHASDVSLAELLRWTGSRDLHDREAVEARLVDFVWQGR